MPFADALRVLRLWAAEGLRNVRFSGGEPTLYPWLDDLVTEARASGTERVALSTNGSADFDAYEKLIERGVDDFSISMDACCAEDGDRMAGGVKGSWERVVENIRRLACLTYVTVGVVLTEDNRGQLNEIVRFAAELGVADVRVIPAAQDGAWLTGLVVETHLLDLFPILRYRVENLRNGRPVRGLRTDDPGRCPLVLDDMAVNRDAHFPCIIYLREGGAPIGLVGPAMREERRRWFLRHDCHEDPICRQNCLDVCIDYNARWMGCHHTPEAIAHE